MNPFDPLMRKAYLEAIIAPLGRLALIASSEGRGVPLLGAFPIAPLDAGDGPRWNTYMPRGEWHGANLASIGGKINLTDAVFAEMIANWESAGKPRLPVRKTHLHLDPNVPAKDRPELEASYAFLADFRIGTTGLETLTDWNDSGRGEVRSGRFANWSPEWYPTHKDRRTGETKGWWLAGAALTNDPFFISMPPVAASVVSTESTEPTPQHRSNTMNEEQLKTLRAKLGLAADATVEQCLTAAEKATNTALTAAAKMDPSAITAAVKEITEPLQAQLAKAAEETKALKASLLERDVDALIVTAKRGDGKTGRAIPDALIAVAKKLAATEGLKASEDFLQALPLTPSLALVPVSQPGTTDGPLTAEAAGKRIAARADELRKAGDPTPTITAMRELPNETLIAENRHSTSQN